MSTAVQTRRSDRRNLLIISDLHLGEDIKPASKTGYLRHVVMLERELERFLTHYTQVRLDGRPWRLVVNGDMVDFLAVCLIPREGEVPDADLDPEDRVYGLGTRPRAAQAKMRRVLERHPGVFRALAQFIGAGNEVSIIVGNHDVEFHWPVVQETFKQGVSSLWSGSRAAQRNGAPTREAIEAAITFHPWFYFQEDVVWVEHGHQYDDYCSFDYQLEPVAPDRDEVILNIGAAGARYLSNHIEGMDPHQQEDWTAGGYLRWVVSQGARGVWKVIRSYFAFVVRMLTTWRRFTTRAAGVEARRRTHREKLRQLAANARLSEETLTALDDLRRSPVMLNFGKLVMALMLDRLLIFAVTLLFTLGFVVALPWGWALAATLTVLVAAMGFGRWLSRQRVVVDPQSKMRAVTQRIRSLVRTPFVVFGHTHYPQAIKLEGGGWYFNTGTWLATEKPGLLQSFTHVMIRHGKQGPRAVLCQWRDGKSTVFSPEARA